MLPRLHVILFSIILMFSMNMYSYEKIEVKNKNLISGLIVAGTIGIAVVATAAYAYFVYSRDTTVDINKQDKEGKTSLHKLIQRNNDNDSFDKHYTEDNSKILSSKRCYVKNSTLFHEQLLKNASSLLNKGANPNIQDQEGKTPLHRISHFVNWHLNFHCYLAQNHVTWNEYDLHTRSYCKLVKTFLENGADPNIPDNYGYYIIFDYWRHQPIFELLLKYGADPSKKTIRNQTIFHNAFMYSRIDPIGIIRLYENFYDHYAKRINISMLMLHKRKDCIVSRLPKCVLMYLLTFTDSFMQDIMDKKDDFGYTASEYCSEHFNNYTEISIIIITNEDYLECKSHFCEILDPKYNHSERSNLIKKFRKWYENCSKNDRDL